MVVILTVIYSFIVENILLTLLRQFVLNHEIIYAIFYFVDIKEILAGCRMKCDEHPCKNQGICIENFQKEKANVIANIRLIMEKTVLLVNNLHINW